MAGAAMANPVKRDDSCAAAVTGKAALGDDSLRKEHCSSFFKTIVTPVPVTVTTTITDAPAATGWEKWKRGDSNTVAICPNEVPNYASACDEAGYKSACSAFGVTGVETTYTAPVSTTTQTVYVPKGGATGTCSAGSTVTVTKEVATATVTKTVTESGSSCSLTGTGGPNAPFPSATATPSKCISDAKATEFAGAFKDLLQYTSYNGTQGAPGRGYHYNVSATYLASDFQDYSDSINWMANFPVSHIDSLLLSFADNTPQLGTVTFGSRAAFDYGQGSLQPELTVSDLYIGHSCNTVTWRWNAQTQSGASVTGLNHFILTEDLSQIQTNYAEFDNAAWLYSFGLTCKVPASSKRSISY